MGGVNSVHNKLAVTPPHSALHAGVQSPFQRAASVVFPSMTKYLFTQEAIEFTQQAKIVELTCKLFQFGIVYARQEAKQEITYAHLSSPETDDAKLALRLVMLANHFPKLDSLELNISNLSVDGLKILAKAPQIRTIVRLTLYGDAEKMKGKKNDELSLLVQSIHYRTLEVLNFGHAGSLPSFPLQLLVANLPSCERLKVFFLPYVLPFHSPDVPKIVDALPGTLEELGPFIMGESGKGSEVAASEAFVDQFMEKCKVPARIKKCDLRVMKKQPEINFGISPEKLEELLRFLPLSTMSHIRFLGPSMDEENLKILASELQKNSDLVELSITYSEGGLPAILALLKSIRSSRLEALEIYDPKNPALSLNWRGKPADLLQALDAKIKELTEIDQARIKDNLSQVREGSQESGSQQ